MKIENRDQEARTIQKEAHDAYLKRKGEKEAARIKFARQMDAVVVLWESGKFSGRELRNFLDLLLGYRTWGETIDVYSILAEDRSLDLAGLPE